MSSHQAEPGRGGAASGRAIRAAIAARGAANVVVATGASQFELLAALVRRDDIDWARVTAFHLERIYRHAESYPRQLPALSRRSASPRPACARRLPLHRGRRADLAAELGAHRRLDRGPSSIDVLFAGIGERPSRVQRSAGGFREDGGFPRRRAGGAPPPPAPGEGWS